MDMITLESQFPAPEAALSPDRDYDRVAAAIRFIDAHRTAQPRLEDIAEAVNLSPYHFQRLFTRWAGVSPKRFLGYITLLHARQLLENSVSVLDTALETGLSGPGRLHDLFVSFDAVTPGEAKRHGAGVTIRYGRGETPFGRAAVGWTERGICRLTFTEAGEDADLRAVITEHWPRATLVAAPQEAQELMRRIFFGTPDEQASLKFHATGTNFQIKVWEAILRLPLGTLATYSQIADAIGHPRAARAVGNALNRNPLAFVVPCHVVVPAILGARREIPYRWGTTRRKAILGWEAARAAVE
ncbi:MAG: methylated-DNA--[protein]-cysteine S-methyltransferase [Magnetospiraceae bacterium]